VRAPGSERKPKPQASALAAACAGDHRARTRSDADRRFFARALRSSDSAISRSFLAAASNGEAERPRRGPAGASFCLRSLGARSAHPHDLSRTAPAIVRSHPTDHHCARAALRRQAKARASNIKRAQASNKEGVGVNHASDSTGRTRRAPGTQSQPHNAASAHLVGAERRRLQDNRVSQRHHAAEPIEGHSQLFAAPNLPKVTSNGEAEGPRRSASHWRRGRKISWRPRRQPRSVSRTPPAIVRRARHDCLRIGARRNSNIRSA
jgi:hypothetical protein